MTNVLDGIKEVEEKTARGVQIVKNMVVKYNINGVDAVMLEYSVKNAYLDGKSTGLELAADIVKLK